MANVEHYKKSGKDVDPFIDKIKEEDEFLERASNIADLMGIEGRSRFTIHHLTFLRKEFEFDKRTRMPPQNMLNCLISFGNSLMYATIL